MDFITDLPVSTDRIGNSYNSILIIIDRLTNMIYYGLIKVTINALSLTEIIIDVVM